ncbi:sigma-70 family RNA polymerase sigma factor [Paenibacillus elgii]|uniref:sigma-70 family RNA polymerase sigma factor n=1 Tax=Paenibacillus elgii TaxID=189691 RepID=UPI0013D6C8CB|nr:sigma-70 family RNA polymerase sigma factor [Paenibacillus elgii]
MSLHDLLLEYRKAKKDLISLYNRTVDKEDRSLISDMISDCEFVEQWLETGRMPGSRRGIDRRSVYQRTKVWDPSWMEQLITKPAGPERELTEDERFKLNDAMCNLSERERQCFVLHIAFRFSMRQIAEELDLKKRTVQTNIERAKQKIEENKLSSLFLVG